MSSSQHRKQTTVDELTLEEWCAQEYAMPECNLPGWDCYLLSTFTNKVVGKVRLGKDLHHVVEWYE